MKIETIKTSNKTLALIKTSDILVRDTASAMDLMASLSYQTDCDHIIITKDAFSESFFDLKTRLAGEILQKFVNYNMKMTIVGDYSIYTSNALKDFIYESNKGRDFFFLSNFEEAISKASLSSKH